MDNIIHIIKKTDVPIISLRGYINEVYKSEFYKCSMCDQVFKRTEEDPIAHSMLCTGY